MIRNASQGRKGNQSEGKTFINKNANEEIKLIYSEGEERKVEEM